MKLTSAEIATNEATLFDRNPISNFPTEEQKCEKILDRAKIPMKIKQFQ